MVAEGNTIYNVCDEMIQKLIGKTNPRNQYALKVFLKKTISNIIDYSNQMQVISTDGNVKTHTNMLKSDVNKGEVLEISLDEENMSSNNIIKIPATVDLNKGDRVTLSYSFNIKRNPENNKKIKENRDKILNQSEQSGGKKNPNKILPKIRKTFKLQKQKKSNKNNSAKKRNTMKKRK